MHKKTLITPILGFILILECLFAFPVSIFAQVPLAFNEATMKQKEARERLVDDVMRVMIMREGSAAMQTMIQDIGMADSRMKDFPQETRQWLGRWMGDQFRSEIIYTDIRRRFLESSESLSDAQLQGFIRNFDIPLVKRMQTLELAAMDAKERENIKNYIGGLEKNMPSDQRLATARRCAVASGSLDVLIETQEKTARRMLAAANPGADLMQLNQKLANLRPQLRERAATMAVSSTLATYRTVDDKSFDEYVVLLEGSGATPVLSRLAKSFAEALDSAMGKFFESVLLMQGGRIPPEVEARIGPMPNVKPTETEKTSQ